MQTDLQSQNNERNKLSENSALHTRRSWMAGILIAASAGTLAAFKLAPNSNEADSTALAKSLLADDSLKLPERSDERVWNREVLNQPSSKDDEGIIINDTYALCSFVYRGKEIPIYKSKNYTSETNPSDAQVDLSRYSFYLPPDLTIELNQMRSAYNSKTKVGEVNGVSIWKMDLPVCIFTEEFRQAASAAVNARFKGANTTADNFSIVPYRYIQFEASGKQGSGIIASYPEIPIDGTPMPGLAGRKLNFNLSVNGTDELLRYIAEEARIEFKFLVSGFSIKQNISDYVLSSIAALGLDQAITGHAEWERFRSVQAKSGGGILNVSSILGFAKKRTIGQSKEGQYSCVTRNQAREVVRSVSSALNCTDWQEFESDPRQLEAFETTILNHLLARMQRVEVGVSREGKLMLDDQLRKDIEPDLVDKAEASIQGQMDMHASKSGSGSLGKVFKASHDQNFEYLDSNDISWTNEGGAIVPKTVSFYQANVSTLRAIERIHSTKILPSGNQICLKSEASFVELTKVPAQYKIIELKHPSVVISAIGKIAGDNADIQSNTKGATEGKVWTDNLTVLPDRVKFTVHFTDKELHGGHTYLGGSQDYEILAPQGCVLVGLDEGVENHDVTLTLYGPTNGEVEADRSATGTWHKDYHNLTQDPHNSNSILRKVLICLDGGGMDDTGAAHLSAEAIIRVKARISDEQVKEEIRPR